MLPDSAASCSVFDADNALEKNREAIQSQGSGVAERFEQTTLHDQGRRRPWESGSIWIWLERGGKRDSTHNSRSLDDNPSSYTERHFPSFLCHHANLRKDPDWQDHHPRGGVFRHD